MVSPAFHIFTSGSDDRDLLLVPGRRRGGGEGETGEKETGRGWVGGVDRGLLGLSSSVCRRRIEMGRWRAAAYAPLRLLSCALSCALSYHEKQNRQQI
jgi:hypothetical protein